MQNLEEEVSMLSFKYFFKVCKFRSVYPRTGSRSHFISERDTTAILEDESDPKNNPGGNNAKIKNERKAEDT